MLGVLSLIAMWIWLESSDEPEVAAYRLPNPSPSVLTSPERGAMPLSEPVQWQGPPIEPLAVGSPPPTGLTVLVVDEAGAPVPGVVVGVYDVIDGGEWHEIATDARGQALVPCSPGTYDVTANADGQATAHGQQWLQAQVDREGPDFVTLVLADARSRLDVFVHDGAGSPVANVLLNADGPAGTLTEGERTTDERGIASWDPIIAGTWHLRVISSDPPRDLSSVRVPPVDVPPAQPATVDVVVLALGEVAVDTGQEPHAGELEELTLTTGGEDEERRAPWIERLVIWSAPPGEHVLRAQWSSESGVWSAPIHVEARPGQRTDVKLQPVTGAVELTGRIVDEVGLPVSGVAIIVTALEDQGVRQSGDAWRRWRARKVAWSDAAGIWHIDGLPAAEMFVSIDTLQTTERYLAQWNNAGVEGIRAAGFLHLGDVVVRSGVELYLRAKSLPSEFRARGDAWLEVVLAAQAGEHEARPVRAVLQPDGGYLLGHRRAGRYSAFFTDSSGAESEHVEFEIEPGTPEGVRVERVLHFDD